MQGTLRVMRYAMYWLNVMAVLFFAGVFFLTPYRAVRAGQSARFVESLPYLPGAPLYGLLVALLGMAILCGMGCVIRRRGLRAAGSLLAVCVLESLLCLAVIFSLHLDYNGLLLLLVVEFIDALRGRERSVFLVLMISLYLLASVDLLQSAFRLVPFSAYLHYYLPGVRQMMMSARSLLIAVNSLLFILYVVILVGQRTEENTSFKLLNNKLARVNRQLQEMNAQLTAYAGEIEHMAQTRERNRLAREIHDTIGHALTGIIAGADACVRMLDTSPELARQQMELIAKTARQGMREVRRSVHALRPDALERCSLPRALEKLADDVEKTTGTRVALRFAREAMSLSADEEDVVYRVVQESITNAVRHGRAAQVCVDIARYDRFLHLRIHDDGCGCKEIKNGFGLQHMQERLRLLGGTLHTDGVAGGFLVEAKLPVRWGKEL